MKLVSSTKITTNYNIDELHEDKCKVTFIDLDSEVIDEKETEEGTVIEYTYDAYQIELVLNEEYFVENFDELLNLAKQFEYDEKATEVRAKRRVLLEETDNECLSDRNPTQEMIKYRQDLRDIPEQEGFPYDVIFPTKPE